MHDADLGNPTTEMDGMGSMYSLSRKHTNFKPMDELLEILRADADAIRLSYYEHGNCLWKAQEAAAPMIPEFDWDGVRFAGVWVPDDCVRESYTGQDGLSRHAWMVKQAASCCETYTFWANGECYGYSIKAYKLRRDDDGEAYDRLSDYRRAATVFEDSCWGYYGWEDTEEAIKEALPDATQLAA
jgi:hypothetical protein